MGKITVVGLGPGAAGSLSLETMELLQAAPQVILRTAVHPTVAELRKRGIGFASCDDIYGRAACFDDVYAQITERVLAAAGAGDVVYAVPGSPFVAERTVQLLRGLAGQRGIALEVKPALSFLDAAYAALQLDPADGLCVADAQAADAADCAGLRPLLLTQVYSRLIASDLKIALMDVLDDEQEIYFLRHLGLPEETCRPLKLYELDRQEDIDHLTSVYVPQADRKKTAAEDGAAESAEADLRPLAGVIKRLRAPGGCPWDIEQTHASIRNNLIEEVYEFLEAVDNGDFAGMREELGDVLMQVVFHARMAEEAGHFTLQEVIDEVTQKLIRRHPHVFGELSVSGSDEVLRNWEAIKKLEKTERTHVLDGVSQGLPALLRAWKLQGKAAKVGFDWQETEPVWQKVLEELRELREAQAAGDKRAAEAELGDVLFAVVNYARHGKIEPETALNGSNNRFAARFACVEEQVRASGRNWQDFTLEELDQFWDAAKRREAMQSSQADRR